MNVIDIHAREEHIIVDENDVLVYSHDSLRDPGQHLVSLMWANGAEIAISADTRGEAMVQLADHLRDISQKLRTMAFEQEGAIKL